MGAMAQDIDDHPIAAKPIRLTLVNTITGRKIQHMRCGQSQSHYLRFGEYTTPFTKSTCQQRLRLLSWDCTWQGSANTIQTMTKSWTS